MAGKATLASVQRDARAAQLRAAGASYREIGQALNVSESRAFTLVQRALTRVPYENVRQVRAEELARLDRWLLRLKPKIDNGEPRAIEVAIKISERRAKLTGADAPQRAEILTYVADLPPEQFLELVIQRALADPTLMLRLADVGISHIEDELGIDALEIEGELVDDTEAVHDTETVHARSDDSVDPGQVKTPQITASPSDAPSPAHEIPWSPDEHADPSPIAHVPRDAEQTKPEPDPEPDEPEPEPAPEPRSRSYTHRPEPPRGPAMSSMWPSGTWRP